VLGGGVSALSSDSDVFCIVASSVGASQRGFSSRGSTQCVGRATQGRRGNRNMSELTVGSGLLALGTILLVAGLTPRRVAARIAREIGAQNKPTTIITIVAGSLAIEPGIIMLLRATVWVS
jgi:hypothetical protein